ncbi:MAG TPA: hypothetical protein VJT09_11610 [Pyrinomonadaceae bacterium]|nr:hypothetical protein [Pyrinomonadaceae bacterium]
MKPLKSETQDTATLQELGRASVQIVHDLKNQLNGLKLYATFLRKRMEKADRPEDEQETVAKLIAGLERAAADMTVLVRMGRPLELRRQPQTDLTKMVTALEAEEAVQVEADTRLTGEFDLAAITEALRTITSSALGMRPAGEAKGLRVSLRPDEDARHAVIEWGGVKLNNGDDPFHSFAGSEGLRMSLAAKIIEGHGGTAAYDGSGALRVRLPIEQQG